MSDGGTGVGASPGVLRGECKVSGGKLVAVEFSVCDGHLANPQLSGDFFLEPDGADQVLQQALVALPVAATTGEIVAALTEAITHAERSGEVAAPIAFIGIDLRAIAVAIRRALGAATTWTDHTFEILRPGPLPIQEVVALDLVLAEELAAGRRGPTLRFWQWSEPAVVIGSFQSLRNEVDAQAAARYQVQVVRRVSGGGAMFMEPGNCVTFSLVVPRSLVDGLSFEQSYAFLDAWVLVALAELGVQARFAGLNDVVSDAGKLAGSAQKRLANGVVIHHMTMAYDIDADKMHQVLRIGRARLSDRGVASARKRVDPLRSQTGLSREAVIAAFEASFARQYDCVPSQLRPEEYARAAQLAREKFGAEEWLNRVP